VYQGCRYVEHLHDLPRDDIEDLGGRPSLGDERRNPSKRSLLVD
jgi:hypothetical protein